MREPIQLKMPITKTARKYGYIIWSKKRHGERMMAILANRSHIDIEWGATKFPKKTIEYKHYRISVGYTLTREIDKNCGYYVITSHKPGTMTVTFE